jgi:hypothetical protein
VTLSCARAAAEPNDPNRTAVDGLSHFCARV